MKTLRTPAAILWLSMLLIAFPQLSETIYAPVLPLIARHYAVTENEAQLTMSLYFAAFAAGIVCWGRVADRAGRRTALLTALVCYGLGALGALAATNFAGLLMARMVLAFGASSGSVVMQTMFRDRYRGEALAGVFSTVGAVLSLSPALGPPLGSALAAHAGQNGVFVALALLSLVLLAAAWQLPETRPADMPPPAPLFRVACRLATDRHVLASAALVAGFNLLVFGFYSLAPFTLEQLGMPLWVFALSGPLIALASAAGAMLNRRWLARHGSGRLIAGAWCAALAGAGLQWLALSGQGGMAATGLLAGQAVLVMAFGCAIPNVLSGALVRYRDILGSAGAVFGLTYYLGIAAGLWLISYFYQPVLPYQGIVTMTLVMVMLPAVVLRGERDPV
ncbi:MFS transporter [Paludibacterium paludis]|uniref:MFS transporter n=1 Tax=Paludibacterium paludis TaxID=1225769 RepID=A0A918UB15_9NEIS|nr:MFS transporter [Paludibacterium paludis]GGY19980.1 MFS transporter [Paludibacterium paludis]